MDCKEEFQNMCSTVNTEIMRPLVMQKEFIYIDVDLLFDFKMGALMSFIKGEEDYNVIQKHMEEYLAAPSLECAKFFPELGVTEEDLLRTLADEQYRIFIQAAAPATKLLAELEDIVKVTYSINRTKETQRPLKIVFNQGLFELMPTVKEMITRSLQQYDKNIGITFTRYRNWFDVPEDLLERQDFICVYDLKGFMTQGTTSQKLMSSDPPKLGSAAIVALKQSELDAEHTEDGLVNLALVMQMMCDKFSFVEKSILNKEPSHG